MDPDKTVLLIVDMQRFCASPDYGVGAYLGGADNPLGRYYFDRLYSAVIPTISACWRSRGRTGSGWRS